MSITAHKWYRRVLNRKTRMDAKKSIFHAFKDWESTEDEVYDFEMMSEAALADYYQKHKDDESLWGDAEKAP